MRTRPVKWSKSVNLRGLKPGAARPACLLPVCQRPLGAAFGCLGTASAGRFDTQRSRHWMSTKSRTRSVYLTIQSLGNSHRRPRWAR